MAVGAAESGPESSSIEIYLRVRPVPKAASNLSIDSEENRAEFTIPKTLTSGCGQALFALPFCPWKLYHDSMTGTYIIKFSC